MRFANRLVLAAYDDNLPRLHHVEGFHMVVGSDETILSVVDRLHSFYPNLSEKYVNDAYSVEMPGGYTLLRFIIDDTAYDADYPPSQLLDMLLRNNLQVDTHYRDMLPV